MESDIKNIGNMIMIVVNYYFFNQLLKLKKT